MNDNAEDAMAKVIADVEKEQREELQGTYAATSVGIENQMNSHIFEISSPNFSVSNCDIFSDFGST